MASLWRPLALAWLGGIASPLLLDEAAITDAAPTVIVGDPAMPSKFRDADAVDRIVEREGDETRDVSPAKGA
jgi:hypothetical protein